MKNTKIGWTDMTFNPVIGCTKVDELCAHCYAEAQNNRFYGGGNWGPGAPRRRTSAAYWRQPLVWDLDAKEAILTHSDTPRPRVFCASLADWLDEEWPIEVLADLMDLIRRTQNLDWLLLTKRPQNWLSQMREVEKMRGDVTWLMIRDWIDGQPPANVWVGTSVGTQKSADVRIPQVLAIPARVRFLSCEPLLSAVDLRFWDGKGSGSVRRNEGISWVIAGCESGPKARPMQTEWAQSLRDQCAAAGVPFFMKQMMVGGKLAHDLADFPADLRVREFPRP